MKNIILALFVITLTSGCMTAHNFIDIQTTPTTQAGYWTGQYNRTLITLQLDPSGHGVVCEDILSDVRLQRVKKANDRLYTQDGSYWQISNETPSTMKLSYALTGSYVVHKDQNLALSSPACLEKLK